MNLNDLTLRTSLAFNELLDRVMRAVQTPEESPSSRPLELEQLEDRVLLSASPAAVVMEVAAPASSSGQMDTFDSASLSTGQSSSATASPNATDVDTVIAETDPQALGQNTSTNREAELGDSSMTGSDQTVRHELVFVDTSVDDYQQLLDDLWSNDDSSREFEVVLLQNSRDGIEQISAALSERSDLDAVHFVTHGTDGRVKLGATWLDVNNLGGYAGEIAGWSKSLTADADLLFYGCSLASNADGRELVESLSTLTGADVAASTDDTGVSILGGDWKLEYQPGAIETSVAFSSDLRGAWFGLLQASADSLWFSTISDVPSPSGAPGLDAWDEDHIVGVTDPNLALGDATNGTFGIEMNLAAFAANGSADIDAIHYVGRDLTLGTTNTFDVQAGDILLSTNQDETLGGVSIGQSDLALFRPDTVGDLSSGTFFLLLDNVDGSTSSEDLKDIALVEQTIVYNGKTLQEGTFLYTSLQTTSGDVQHFTADEVGAGTTSGTTSVFIDGSDIGISDNVRGIEIASETTDVGGLTLSAGAVVLSLDADDAAVGNNSLATESHDFFYLDVTMAGATTAADAFMLFDGSDVNLNTTAEVPYAIALLDNSGVNNAPVLTLLSGSVSFTEGDPATIIDAAATATDVDSADLDTGSLTVDFTANGTANDRLAINNQGTGSGQIGVSGSNVTYEGTVIGTFAGGTDGSTPLVITFNAISTPTAAQALTRNITYENVSQDPSELARTVRFVLTDGDGETSAAATETINVSKANDAPVGVVASNFTAIDEDDFTSAGQLVSAFTTTTIDADSGAVKGIAVIDVDNTNGTWEYTLDGTNWVAIGNVSNSMARLLPSDATARVRFVPDPNYNGVASPFTVVAWDQTSGVAGGLADASTRGGTTAFSIASAAVGQSVNAINDDPTITSNGGGATSAVNVAENTTAVTTVTSSDVDGGTPVYSISGGADAAKFAINSSSGILTFVSAPDFEIPTDVGTNNVYDVTVQVYDGALTDTQAISVTVTDTNDSPSVGNGVLASVHNLDTDPSGQTVSALFNVSFSDPDAGSSLAGIAVTANTANSLTEGTWQYSSNSGTDWFDIGTVGDGPTALAIDSATLVRFVPVGGFVGTPGTLSIRALDNTYAGSFSTTVGSETRVNVDTTTNGATTAIAGAMSSLSTSVTDDSAFLWLVSKGNVGSPSGAPGLDSWTDSTVLQFGDPNLTLGEGTTDGTFSATFDLDAFASSDSRVHSIHRVNRSVTLGGTSFPAINVDAGDVLFSTKENETLTSVNAINVKPTDVVLFSPTTAGDYSSGTFTLLLDDVNGNDIHAITLVEQATKLPDGTVLNEGDFLFATGSDARELLWFVTDDVGAGQTAGTVRVLIDGNDSNVNLATDFKAIDLVEVDTSVGGVNLTAGQILLATKDSVTGGSNN